MRRLVKDIQIPVAALTALAGRPPREVYADGEGEGACLCWGEQEQEQEHDQEVGEGEGVDVSRPVPWGFLDDFLTAADGQVF